jgi:glyoxylase-like metal-dependent hydrolase (beta-lactamase superfamily II)
MKEILPGIFQWSWFSQEKGMDFNGHLIVEGNERAIIDPPPMSPEDQIQIERLRPIGFILITNRDHIREAETCQKIFRARLLVPEKDAPEIPVRVDGTYKSGDVLPCGLTTIHIPDAKSPGECAFLLNRGKGVLILGDALIGKPPGKLNLLPPDKFADSKKAKEGLKGLLAVSFDAILVGDGVSILTQGKKAVQDFLR